MHVSAQPQGTPVLLTNYVQQQQKPQSPLSTFQIAQPETINQREGQQKIQQQVIQTASKQPQNIFDQEVRCICLSPTEFQFN